MTELPSPRFIPMVGMCPSFIVECKDHSVNYLGGFPTDVFLFNIFIKHVTFINRFNYLQKYTNMDNDKYSKQK